MTLNMNQIKEVLSQFEQRDKNYTKLCKCFTNRSNLHDTMAQQEYQMYQIRDDQIK